MFTGIRSSIEIHHDDGKGYAYPVLNQLCPKSWGNYALIRKRNQLSYYSYDVRLEAYVKEMCNKISNEYGSTSKEEDIWIGEKGLIFIPRIYNKLLIVFHTSLRNRKINLYFQNSQIPSFIFDSDSYNDILNSQIRKMEQQQLGVGKYFDELTYKRDISKILFINE
jgi:hypothetical protein